MKKRGTLPSYLLQGGNKNGSNYVSWLMAVATLKEGLQPVVIALSWWLEGDQSF